MPAPFDTYLLRDALADVQAFLTTLNTAQSTCECCGVIKYDSLEENRAHQELTGVANKIARHLNAFEIKNNSQENTS